MQQQKVNDYEETAFPWLLRDGATVSFSRTKGMHLPLARFQWEHHQVTPDCIGDKCTVLHAVLDTDLEVGKRVTGRCNRFVRYPDLFKSWRNKAWDPADCEQAGMLFGDITLRCTEIDGGSGPAQLTIETSSCNRHLPFSYTWSRKEVLEASAIPEWQPWADALLTRDVDFEEHICAPGPQSAVSWSQPIASHSIDDVMHVRLHAAELLRHCAEDEKCKAVAVEYDAQATYHIHLLKQFVCRPGPETLVTSYLKGEKVKARILQQDLGYGAVGEVAVGWELSAEDPTSLVHVRFYGESTSRTLLPEQIELSEDQWPLARNGD